MANYAPLAVLDSPVRSIMLIEKIVRPNLGKFRSVSPPGHLIHLVLSGRIEQYSDNRCQTLKPGDLVWYHNMESIEGTIMEAPWQFISINFIAPRLSPAPDRERIRPARETEIRKINTLIRKWRLPSSDPARPYECFAVLNQLLSELSSSAAGTAHDHSLTDTVTDRWWQIEKSLRLDLTSIPSLPEIARKAGLSLRTLTRVCQAATGLTPARRIAALRIAQGRHLLKVTRLTVTEIALKVGFSRVQEFSRAMRKHTDLAPSEFRLDQRPRTGS